MSELIEAAEAVIGRWDRSPLSVDSLTMNDLRDAVKQAESDKVDRDDALFAACMYGAKTERERIRARAQIAAEKTWPAGDWYIGPQHNMIEKFVEELLREDDDT